MRFHNRISKMSNILYLAVTVGISVILTYLLEKYAITSIAYPTFDMYFRAEKIRMIFSVLNPILSVIGAVITFQYKSVSQIVLNVLLPFEILLTVMAAQRHFFAIVIILIIAIGYALFCVGMKVVHAKTTGRRYKASFLICFARENLILVLLVSTVLGVYSSIKAESSMDEWILESRTVNTENIEKSEDLELELVSPKEFAEMDLKDRTNETEKLARYICAEKGLGEIDISVIKMEDDGTLAFFNGTGEVTINAVYLATCELDGENGMMFTLCHELTHAEQFALIDTLIELEEAGIEYMDLPYFDYANKLKDAAEVYATDSYLGYDSYNNNFLETEADVYASQKLQEISEMLGWE